MAPKQNGFADDQPWAGAVTVVLISPFEEDHICLKRMLAEADCKIHWVQNHQQALSVLRENRAAVVISECNLPEGSWKDVFSQLQPLANPPLLIVTSQHADDHLWAEVLNLGGYDVLLKPFHGAEVTRVVSLACQYWKNRLERAKASTTNNAFRTAGQAS